MTVLVLNVSFKSRTSFEKKILKIKTTSSPPSHDSGIN